jgi:2,4-dienoyl-CoA reductase-like NADH-dependent reductase (Old Yellow Enzyme family)
MTNDVFSPGRLGELDLRNRVIKTATFEGMCPGGEVTEPLIEHHRAMAAGGVGMTTVAYCSVSPDGRTYGHQMYMRPEILPGLRRLTEAVHAEGAAAALQLGHCGYFASKKVIGVAPLSPSKVFNLYGMSYGRPMTPEDMARVADDFARSTALAREAGFDAVELHYGHGYLLSQFLSPFTNRRSDEYGGSLNNRLRFPLQVLGRVREEVGPGYPVVVKMNLSDGFRRGLQPAESVVVAQRLEAAGATALVLSGGFVSKTPLYMMRGNVPTWEMVRVQAGWFRKVGLALFGRIFVQRYPFEELFFLRESLAVREAVELPLVLIGGILSRKGLERAMGSGFDFVALGRALIHDAQFLQKLQRGDIERSDCDQCNRCIAEMDAGGVRCPCAEE